MFLAQPEAALFELPDDTLEKIVGEGLIAISDVEVIRYTHRDATGV